MENWEVWQDRINQYLNDEMTTSDRKGFEAELAINSELSTELELNKAIHEGAITFGSKDLKSRLKNIHQNNFPQKTQKNNSNKTKWIVLLVGLLLLVLLSFFIFSKFQKTEPVPKKLYAEYYQPFDLNIQVRADQQNTTLDLAQTFYSNKEYEKAITLFDSLIIQDSQNSVLIISRANAYLQTNQFQKANLDLDNIISTNDPYLLNQALWYKALTFLKQGDIESSKKLLLQLSQKAGVDFQKEATQLLSELN